MAAIFCLLFAAVTFAAPAPVRQSSDVILRRIPQDDKQMREKTQWATVRIAQIKLLALQMRCSVGSSS